MDISDARVSTLGVGLPIVRIAVESAVSVSEYPDSNAVD